MGGLSKLITGFDEVIASWVAENLDDFDSVEDFGDCKAIGCHVGGELAAGVVYHNYRKHSIEMSIYASNTRWCTRGTLAGFFAYPFLSLQVNRITALINESNARSRKLVEGLGFQYEGNHRKAFKDGSNCTSYGMLREECKWLPNQEGS